MLPIPPSMLPAADTLVLSLDRATIMFKQNMGHAYTVLQVRNLRVYRAPFAQHEAGVYWAYTPKGGRSGRAFGDGLPSTLLVIDGWKDAAVPSVFGPEVESSPGVYVSKGRAMSCDPIWTSEAVTAARNAGAILFNAHETGAHQ